MVTGVLIPLVLLTTGMTGTESHVNGAAKEPAGDLENLIWSVAIGVGIFFVFRMVTGWIKTAMPEGRSIADIQTQLNKDREAGVVLKPRGLKSQDAEAAPVAVRMPSDLPPSSTPVREHRAAFRLQPVAGGAEHQLVRAASYLDRWMWQHRGHFPRSGRLPFAYAPGRRQIRLPVVTGVTTGSVKAWSKAERKRLFRVVYADAWENGQGFLEVPIDVLAVNWSAEKTRLDTDALVEAALAVSAGGRWRSRLSPRMIWFRLTQDTGRLKRTMESYIDEMQLDEDGKAVLPQRNKAVWEEQSVPRKEGQRTPLGRGCFFVVHTITPYGSREPLWLFSVERDDVPILKDQRLRAPNFIEVDGTLLATIVSVNDSSVILKVLAPGSAAVSLKTSIKARTHVAWRSLFRSRF
jgi:hypothetical protein